MKKKTVSQILSLLLIFTLVLGGTPVAQIPVYAAEEPAQIGGDQVPPSVIGEIVAFAELAPEIAAQTVPPGTDESELNLPDTLAVTVRLTSTEQDADSVIDPVYTSAVTGSAFIVANQEEQNQGQDGQEGTGETNASEPVTMDVLVPVTWTSSPKYDGNTAGVYTFTAATADYTLSAGPPVITVTVAEAARGVITDFTELEEDVRWQNTTEPMLPATVRGTVEGTATAIPVIWQADHGYDAGAPQPGLYVFTAQAGEGYTLAGGVEAPRITVFIPETASRFAPFRMGGGGTDASPLEITTADQLAEIAVLVNAGRLESFLLNSKGNVSLKLMNDLDLSAYGQDYNSGKGWVPIGGYINNKVMPFKGNFDGDGYMISGLYINDISRDYVGLFGMIESATIQNLNLKAVSVSANRNVGSIIGNASGSGEITTCRVSGSVSGVSNVGGIIGSTYSMTPKYSMSRCSFEGSVSGDVNISGDLIGGLAGTAKDLTILYAYASATVSGNENVGGLVGKLEGSNGKLQNCYAIGNVIGKSSVGGLAGLPYSSSIENCVALNSGVEATGTYGGRVTGQNYNGTLSGNAAFLGMVVTVNGSAKTITSDAASVDGADITAATIKGDGTIGGRFTEDNGWTVQLGKLPGFGAAVNMPEYITDGSDLNFSGEGTEESPFLIGTAEKLAELAKLVNAGNTSYNAKYYKLIADIDLSNYGASNTDFNSGRGWVPIGNNINKFMGSFDGNGKTITRLYIDDTGRDYVGLFGYIKENSAVIHNLTVKDASIDAGGSTGGIVGRAEGGARINHCSVNGTVTGSGNIGGVVGFLHEASMDQCGADVAVSGSTIGGVVGKVEKNSSVINCYAIGSITDKGGNYDTYSYMGVGGVAGSVNGGSTVENCYSTDSIYSTSTGSVYVAGVVGYVSGSTVKNCAALNTSISGSYNAFLVRVGGCSNKLSSTFSDNIAFNGVSCTITSRDIDYNGTDKTADELQSAGGFPSAFTTDPWTYEPGKLPGLFGKTVEMPAHITAKLTSAGYFAGGTGSYSNPYQIATAAQLAKLAELVNAGGYDGKYYRLTADIDLSGYGKNYRGGKGWVPIGTEANPFRGEFDGNGKVISGLYINRPDEDYIGLFGYISHTIIDYLSEPSSVRKLGIVNANIIGRDIVGGLVGQFGSVEALFDMVDNYVTGSISGNNNVGGLAGYVDWTNMASCYSTAMVTGNDNIGGLLGYNNASAVQSCYATGVITGNHNVGGVVGEVVSGLVQHCYSIGSVNGNDHVGGIAGYATKQDGSSDTRIENCAALNPSVSGSAANIGRVAGTAVNTTLVSNYAFSTMKVNSSTVSSTDSESKNGADMTIAQANTAGFWTDTSIFTKPWPEWDYWTLANGKLPTLKRISGQPGDGGVHLTERDIANATVEITDSPFTYTGGPIEPTLTVIFDGETLVKGTDYIMEVAAGSASNGTNAGAVTAKLVGKGNFKGEKTGLSYTIQPKPLTDDMLVTTEFSYTGKEQKPALTDVAATLAEGVDYTASYTNNTNAGTAYMSVTGKGNYSGTLNKIFTIARAPLTITGGTVAAKTYNGTTTAYVTDVNFGGLQNGETLTLNDDYTVTGAKFDSADAGENKALTAAVALESTGTTKNYTLTSENLSLTNQSIAKANAVGVNQTLNVFINRAENYDFALTTLLPTPDSPKSLGAVTYLPSITANTDSVLDTLNYNSGDTLTIPVQLVSAAGKTATITVTVSSTNYKDFTATITVKTIDEISLTITGLTVNNKAYDGTTAATLSGKASLNTTNVQAGDEVALTGTPSAVFADAYVGAGKTVTITGLSLTGKDAAKYTLDLSGFAGTITAKTLIDDMVALSGGPFTYTGMAHTPDVTVKDGSTTLVKGPDYTVGYLNNTDAGTATVNVTGIGNYTGTAGKDFTISKATPAPLTWPGASAITYGANLSDSSLTGGSATGTWAWTVGTTVPPAGTAGYEVTFTPADITNYDWSGVTLRKNVSLTVNKASWLTVSTQPSMNAKEGVTRSYEFSMDNIALSEVDTGAKTYSAAEGTDVSGILSNVQVNGSKLTYAISNTAAVGNTATIIITISTANYDNATATLTITVTAKDTQTIGFEDAAVTKTYGDAKFTQTATQKSGSGTGQITYASDNAAVATVNATTGEVTIVGAGSANITATKAADDDWYAATATYGLTVNKKTVTITAHDKTAKVGQSQPAYTYAVTGLVSGESLTIEPTVTCPTANMSTTGSYPIVPSGAAASANYAIRYQNGTLTVSALSTACDVVSVVSPASSAIGGTSITATVANSVGSQLVGVTVSTDAAWALYSDASCTSEITNKTMTLSVGANTAYIKVTAGDGITAKIYTVTITRAASTGGGDSGGGSGGGSPSGGSSGSQADTQAGSSINQAISSGQTETTITAAGGGSITLSASDLTRQNESSLTVNIRYPDLQIALNPGALPQPAAGGSLQLSAAPVTDPGELNALYIMAPDGRRIGVGYSIAINEVNGTQNQAITQLNGEITLSFALSAEDLAGIDPASLTVYKVDDSGSVIELGGQYQNGSITVSTSHLCRFFITGKVAKERLQGPDRYLTAAAISQKGWEQGDNVILASGENYADALTGAVLAGMLDAPVLLTGKGGLNEAAFSEIKRLLAKNIYIIGGTGVVSASAEAQLKEAYNVQRLQGADRYGTAAAVGEKIKEQKNNAQKSLDTVILATAQNYPDALAIAPFAAQAGIPILFTAGENLNPVTKQALTDWGIQNVIIAGGTGAVAVSVEDELSNSLQIKVRRLSGADRYLTALAIAKYFGPKGDYAGVVVATGESFADALAGASFAAKNNYPVLLTGKKQTTGEVLDYIGDLVIDKAYILGGEGAISDKVKEAIY